MRIRSFGALLLASAGIAGTAVAQQPIAARLAAGRPMPKAAIRTPLVLRSDVPGPNDVVPDPSLVSGFGATVNGINTNGIARLSIFVTPTTGFSCTGALIAPTVMLTAAHCVTDDLTGALVTTQDRVRARFVGPGNAPVDVWSNRILVRSGWHGFSNPLTNGGFDVALVFLTQSAQPWMTQYDIFAGDPYAPWFANTDFVGYGEFGSGLYGPQGFDRARRWGQNRVDYVSDGNFDPADPGILWTDFDNGRPQNDAFCWATGNGAGNPFCNVGRGPTEYGLGAGDSGGPMFINGQIAGVASFGTYFCANAECRRPAVPPLYRAGVTQGWGSLNGYASVAYNAGWILGEVGTSAQHAQAVVATPEPTSLALTFGGVLALVAVARRRRA